MSIRRGVLSVSFVLMAVGIGGCGRTALVPRHDGGGARGDAAADRALSPPETALPSKPDLAIDQAIRTPDSNPDRSADTTPDRPSDSLPDLPRDLGIERSPDLARDTAVDRILPGYDLGLERWRLGDTAVDRIADRPADRALDVSVVKSDVAVDAGAGDLGENDGGAWLSVVAGTLSGPGAMDGIGPSAQFYFPSGVAYDGAGNLYIADSANNTIRKMVLATREVTTIAGLMGDVYGSDDGVGASARFYSPQGLAADGAGNLYIADSANHTIRKMVLSSGKVTTIAGAAGESGHLDARGSAARFMFPTGLTLDGAGNLYVSSDDNTIRRVVLATGDVTTVAGEPMVGGYQDGLGEEVHFSRPKGVAADKAGNLYVADTENCLIRKIVLATGVVTTLAGSFGTWGHDEGIGAEASFSAPQGLALDGAGTLYVADRYGWRIRKIVLATAAVSNIEGDPKWQSTAYLAFDASGNLYVTDVDGHTVSRVSLATLAVEIIGGRLVVRGSKDGVGAAATFYGPEGLASDQQGGVFVATDGNTIRKVDVASGRVTTLAGNPDGPASSNDGNGTAAGFNAPTALAYDGRGTLYIADTGNHTIRKMVVETGAVTTLAGSPGINETRDGKGTLAHFNAPSGVALDGAGNLFVAETKGQVIRKIVLADAMVTTLAGKASSPGSADGLGGQARFSSPSGLTCDGAGNLYVADAGNCTVRQIDIATGRATTLAGEASVWEGRDGTGSGAHFKQPFALAMDSAGRLLVSDVPDNTVRRIELATKQVTTIVGHSGRWQTVPGPLPAYVSSPAGLAVLPSGDLVISDVEANVILLAHF
jgi:sugar lactone lactonase YvrE